MSGTEIVTLVAGGMEYSAWEEIEITAAVNEACRTFKVSTTERPGQFSFPPGTPVTVLASGTLLLAGYVNKYDASGAATTHKVSISGRSKAQDHVDCSATHKRGYAKDKSPVDFARETDHFGVGINDKLGLRPVPYQQIYQGETGFQLLERQLRPHGAYQMGEPDGSVSVTNASVATRAGGALVEGVNIKEWSVNLSDNRRFSDYSVKGQRREGQGAENLRIHEQARDSGVGRYRPRLIVSETDTDKKTARDRADHEKERCAGNGTKGSVTTQGWRDDAGAIWMPNTIIYVHSPTLMHLEQDMLIEKIALKQSGTGGGTVAELSLVDPRSYRGSGHDGKGSDQAWNAGMSGR